MSPSGTLPYPTTVSVAVDDGWIAFRGEMCCQYHRMDAYGTVRHLFGVRGVTALVCIKPQQPTFSDLKGSIHGAQGFSR